MTSCFFNVKTTNSLHSSAELEVAQKLKTMFLLQRSFKLDCFSATFLKFTSSKTGSGSGVFFQTQCGPEQDSPFPMCICNNLPADFALCSFKCSIFPCCHTPSVPITYSLLPSRGNWQAHGVTQIFLSEEHG